MVLLYRTAAHLSALMNILTGTSNYFNMAVMKTIIKIDKENLTVKILSIMMNQKIRITTDIGSVILRIYGPDL
jgi:hypothetical protein